MLWTPFGAPSCPCHRRFPRLPTCLPLLTRFGGNQQPHGGRSCSLQNRAPRTEEGFFCPQPPPAALAAQRCPVNSSCIGTGNVCLLGPAAGLPWAHPPRVRQPVLATRQGLPPRPHRPRGRGSENVVWYSALAMLTTFLAVTQLCPGPQTTFSC